MQLVIMNETGHTDLEVTMTEAIEQINEHPTHWVFIDGELTSRETISQVDWTSVDNYYQTLTFTRNTQNTYQHREEGSHGKRFATET